MRIIKVLVAALVIASFATGCACRTKKVGPEGNIPFASDGGPLADVHFGFDRYDITSEAQSVLAKNAEWLKANADATVQVEGHCDERGTNEYNQALGARRAQSALNALKTLGVDAKRMSSVSYGEELPLDPRHNEEAWAKNRRAHFKVQ